MKFIDDVCEYDFVFVWTTSASPEQAAARLGIRTDDAKWWAAKLRWAGVRLKRMAARELMSRPQAARVIGTSVSGIRRLLEEDEVEGVREGNRQYIYADSVTDFLLRNEVRRTESGLAPWWEARGCYVVSRKSDGLLWDGCG